MANQTILDLLGNDAAYYLDHKCQTISKDDLYTPSKKTVDEVWINSNRNPQTLRSIQTLLGNGRLKNTGYVLFYQLTRVSNTVPEPLLRQTLFILTLKILSNSHWKVVAMQLLPRMAS
jgi:hypothetical protein